MPAAFAAAASASMSAPGSLGCRRLMIDANPISLILGTTSALIAPVQATVVSRRWKLVIPPTVSEVTSCARNGAAMDEAAIKPAAIRKRDFTAILLRWKALSLPLH